MNELDERIRRELDAVTADTGHDEDETIWLLSYADLMTLLFTFFVMLYSAVQMNEGQTLRNSLAEFLQGKGDANTQAMNAMAPNADNLNDLKKALQQRLEEEKLLQDVDLAIQQNGLDVTFSSSLLFDKGKAQLRAESRQTLEKMIAIIKEKGANLKIRVEGHTDSSLIRKNARFKSNWELSGSRAANIIAMFEKQGFPPENLIAVGYGSSRPLVPDRKPSGERDAEAQRRNRRVVLTVYSVVPEKAK